MEEIFDRIIKALDKKGEDDTCGGSGCLWKDDAIEIVRDIEKEYSTNIRYNLANTYARNIVNYGIDVTKTWDTAVSQSCALNQAYMQGLYEGSSRNNNGWVLASDIQPVCTSEDKAIHVLVLLRNGEIKEGYYHCGCRNGYWSDGYTNLSDVYAWQLFPEAIDII